MYEELFSKYRENPSENGGLTVGIRRKVRSSIRGNIDQWSPQLVGWAYDAEALDTPVDLAVFVDDVEVARLKASEARPDVSRAGHEVLHCGFSFEILEFLSGASHVRVTEVSSEREIFSSPITPGANGSEIGGASFLGDYGDDESFVGAVQAGGSVALLSSHRSHYVSDGALRLLVESLQAEGVVVVVIDSSKEEPTDLFGAEKVLWRRNSGFDFASWCAAFEKYESVFRSCERLYLVNDSCLGPVNGLGELLAKGWGLDVDVWSCTDSWNHGHHLQSYFLAFGKESIAEGALPRFIDSYSHPLAKHDVIAEGELALSRQLLSVGVELAAVYPYEDLVQRFLSSFEAELTRKMSAPEVRALREVDSSYVPQDVVALRSIYESVRVGHPLNPTHAFWRQLLDSGFPFMKRDLLALDPSGVSDHVEILEWLSKKGSKNFLEVANEDLKRRDSNRVQTLNT